MTNSLRRLVRRFWVPRAEYDQAIEALRLAYEHIVCHHASHVVQSPGAFCPVCHHKDGSEPEMDEIAAVIHSANIPHHAEDDSGRTIA